MYTRFASSPGLRIEPIEIAVGQWGRGLKEASWRFVAGGRVRHPSIRFRCASLAARAGDGNHRADSYLRGNCGDPPGGRRGRRGRSLRRTFASTCLFVGPGGQSVNTTDRRSDHAHPDGIVVSQQDQKSQLQNKLKGMEVLRARLLDRMIAEQEAARSARRRQWSERRPFRQDPHI